MQLTNHSAPLDGVTKQEALVDTLQTDLLHVFRRSIRTTCDDSTDNISVAIASEFILLIFRKTAKTRMWANAQRDGRPAEYRWRPLSTSQSLADAHYLSATQ